MSVLNKLLGMLDELKEENPELANKALLAAETLKSGIDPEELEEDWDEEEFDDSYVEITPEDTRLFFKLKEDFKESLVNYGTYMRDHEVKKNLMLENIEVLRKDNEDIIGVFRDKYQLDPSSEYSLEISADGSGNIVFVKQ